jgi:hypothetical protein
MCDVCNNNAIRTYTHSRNKRHLRLLIKLMKIKKNTNFYCIRGDGQRMPIQSVNKELQFR